MDAMIVGESVAPCVSRYLFLVLIGRPVRILLFGVFQGLAVKVVLLAEGVDFDGRLRNFLANEELSHDLDAALRQVKVLLLRAAHVGVAIQAQVRVGICL